MMHLIYTPPTPTYDTLPQIGPINLKDLRELTTQHAPLEVLQILPLPDVKRVIIDAMIEHPHLRQEGPAVYNEISRQRAEQANAQLSIVR